LKLIIRLLNAKVYRTRNMPDPFHQAAREFEITREISAGDLNVNRGG